MEARRGGRRKPVITVRPLAAGEGEPLGQVRLRELPHVFGGTAKGSERTWLQYVNDDLSMVHRTYHVAVLDWDRRQVHQIETEYYEPEFPEARLWLQEWVEETDETWRTVMWGQRYPNATAELRPQEAVMARVLRPGEGGVEAATYLLDSCGQFQARCLRLWSGSGEGDDASPLHEYFVDEDGCCLWGRYWGPAEQPAADAVTMEREGRRYALRWEQVPNRLVRAIW